MNDPQHRNRRRRASTALAAGAAALLLMAGCQQTPAPPRVAVPATSNRDALRESDYVKPLPPEDDRIDLRVDQRATPSPAQAPAPWHPSERETTPPPSSPAPSVAATTPPPAAQEQTPPATPPMPADAAARVRKDFVDAYRQVGQPRIVVFVNRTFDGQLLPDPSAPPDDRPPGPDPLHPDQYDAAAVGHSIDLAALESSLADQMSCDHQVMVLPPATVHQKLIDPQVRDLQAGKAQALAAVDQSLTADVLIQVQVQVMKQSGSAYDLRILAEAINVRGGQVIGHAIADIDRPQDADQMKGATQYISRKLMIDMLRAWTEPPPGSSDNQQPNTSSSSSAPRP